MSSYTTSSSASPFTRAVVQSMRKLYPESLADKSFDNTGLLLEAPFDPLRRQMNSVLLAVDLTRAVATEAIENKHCCVVAYHPLIFRGLKSLTLADSQQASLLRLALEGISVYCPHTAVDAVPGGMTDWLCDIVTGGLEEEPQTDGNATVAEPAAPGPAQQSPPTQCSDRNGQPHTPSKQQQQQPPPRGLQPKPEDDVFGDQAAASSTTGKSSTLHRPHMKRAYSRPIYPQSSKPNPDSKPSPLEPSRLSHTRRVIHPSSPFSVVGAGFGRLITFQQAQPLTHLIERIARGVGTPKGFPVAIPQSRQVEDILVRSVGICPGSGASVLRDCGADLIFTGELAHHDALAVTERGGSVVTLFHSNSERGYLHTVMKAKLEDELKVQWRRVRQDYLAGKPMPESIAGGSSEPRRTDGGGNDDDGDYDGNNNDEDNDDDDDAASGMLVSEELEDALADHTVNVEVSAVDRDPYGIVVLEGSEVEGIKI